MFNKWTKKHVKISLNDEIFFDDITYVSCSDISVKTIQIPEELYNSLKTKGFKVDVIKKHILGNEKIYVYRDNIEMPKEYFKKARSFSNSILGTSSDIEKDYIEQVNKENLGKILLVEYDDIN